MVFPPSPLHQDLGKVTYCSGRDQNFVHLNLLNCPNQSTVQVHSYHPGDFVQIDKMKYVQLV